MPEPGRAKDIPSAPVPEIERGVEHGTDPPAMCYCPVCSTRLLSLRCKLICEQCGYFMSCADYY